MKKLSYFDKNRISNIVWTITNKYGYDVDYSLIKEDYFAYDLLYNAVIIGSLYNILDYKMILEFVNHIRSKIKKNDEIINIFFMCIESTCVTKNTEFISNIKNIREKNYKEKIKSLNTGKNKDRLYNVLKLAYCSKYLSQNLLYPDNIKSLIDSIYEFEKVENTIEFIEKFKQIINNLDLKYIHISNSAGITNFSDEIVGNLVRLGIGMYSFTGNKKTPYLKNVYTLKSRILFLKEIHHESFVSYGRHYKLPANETYAVIPIGYADGLKKYLTKGGYVLWKGIKCEIIGNICMDMTMIKIPKEIINSIKIGDEVTVMDADIINDLNIDEFCAWEFMSGLGKRVKRIFI